MRQGAASIRKIGGDLQGEPILPVDAGSARACRDETMPKGFFKHSFRRTADNTEQSTGKDSRQFASIEPHHRVWQVSETGPSALCTEQEEAGHVFDRRTSSTLLLTRLPKKRREPSGADRFAFSESGKIGLLELLPGGCGRSIPRLAQCIQNLRLADATEVICGGRREPCLHVEAYG